MEPQPSETSREAKALWQGFLFRPWTGQSPYSMPSVGLYLVGAATSRPAQDSMHVRLERGGGHPQEAHSHPPIRGTDRTHDAPVTANSLALEALCHGWARSAGPLG